MSEILPAPNSTLPSPLPASVFVGREEQIAAFRHYVEAESDERGRVLVFHGPTGCGKSMLLRALHAGLQDVVPPIPHAWFNLRNVNDRPQAYREVLTSWRVTLQENFGLRFPRYDLCLALILAAEANDASPFLAWCPSLEPLYQLAKAMLAHPQSAHTQLNKEASLAAGANFWLALGEDGLPIIQSLVRRVADNNPNVAMELVDYFARDLGAGFWGRPGKAIAGVLFLDSYESLWPGEQVLLPEFAHHVDGWVRELAAFCLMQGVLLVIGAREPLPWAGNDGDWTKTDLEQPEIGGLTPTQAQDFLARCGIGPSHPEAPSSLQRAIMRSSSPGLSGGFLNQWTNRQLGDSLPLWLALCADTVQNARRAGKPDPGAASFALVSSAGPGKKLCNLFLKSFRDAEQADWLTEIALTPRCDAAAAPASHGLSDDAWQRNWERFTELSFVEDQGDGCWRIEPAVRGVLLEQQRRDQTLEAHLNFSHHWSERGQEALVWFHKWAIDPKGALEEWTKLHEEALKQGETSPQSAARAREILSWWGEIALDERDLESIEAKVWARAHATLAKALLDTPFLTRSPALALALAHYESALSVFTSDEFPREWAQTQIEMGTVQRALAGECSEGAKHEYLKAAIERYRAALRVATPQAAPREWGEIHIHMAAAHRDLVALDTSGSRPYDYLGRAISCYEQALRLYSESRHPREWARIQMQMGETYVAAQSGGRARNLERALACFQTAQRVFKEAETPREWAELMSATGNAMAELPGGERGENLRAALSCFVGALRVFNEADTPLQFAQTNLQTGLAWGELAYVSDDRTAFRNAVNYISTAAQSFEHAGRLGEAAKARELAADISASLKRAP